MVMMCTAHVTTILETRNAYRILVGDMKTDFRKTKKRPRNNINMDPNENGCEVT
jgi:hypothetical protein